MYIPLLTIKSSGCFCTADDSEFDDFICLSSGWEDGEDPLGVGFKSFEDKALCSNCGCGGVLGFGTTAGRNSGATEGDLLLAGLKQASLVDESVFWSICTDCWWWDVDDLLLLDLSDEGDLNIWKKEINVF